MLGRGEKYRIPRELVPAVQAMQEFKDPVRQAHVHLKDGREFVVRIWYPDRIWAIKGYTYLPFSGMDIEKIYQTEQDLRGQPRDKEWMLLDDWALSQLFSPTRWRLKFRELTHPPRSAAAS